MRAAQQHARVHISVRSMTNGGGPSFLDAKAARSLRIAGVNSRRAADAFARAVP
jgi:hypothetical protein